MVNQKDNHLVKLLQRALKGLRVVNAERKK